MGKLIYTLNVSLDGYIETPEKSLDWTVVDDELHQWFSDRMRGISASIYGRRLYEGMAASWPKMSSNPSATPVLLDYAAVWMATPRFVFSNTLESVEWNSRLVRGDVGAVLEGIRAEIDGDIELAGPTIAAQFVRRGLVDEYGVVVHPVILGGGTPFLPQLDAPIRLRLKETRSFKSGAVYMAYDVVRDGEPA